MSDFKSIILPYEFHCAPKSTAAPLRTFYGSIASMGEVTKVEAQEDCARE